MNLHFKSFASAITSKRQSTDKLRLLSFTWWGAVIATTRIIHYPLSKNAFGERFRSRNKSGRSNETFWHSLWCFSDHMKLKVTFHFLKKAKSKSLEKDHFTSARCPFMAWRKKDFAKEEITRFVTLKKCFIEKHFIDHLLANVRHKRSKKIPSSFDYSADTSPRTRSRVIANVLKPFRTKEHY